MAWREEGEGGGKWMRRRGEGGRRRESIVEGVGELNVEGEVSCKGS